jgi:hypothetical protein
MTAYTIDSASRAAPGETPTGSHPCEEKAAALLPLLVVHAVAQPPPSEYGRGVAWGGGGGEVRGLPGKGGSD